MKRNMRIVWGLGASLFGMAWLCTACADDDFSMPVAADDSGVAVSFSSTKQFLITRSNGDPQKYQVGSEYRLFAVQHPTPDKEGDAASNLWLDDVKIDGGQVMYSMPGIETANHEIFYNFTKQVNFNYLRSDVLDFYAIVVDKEADQKNADGENIYSLRSYVDKLVKDGYSPLDSTKRADSKDPTIPWRNGTCSADANRPGDLMFSSALKRSFADGPITLDFEHALARFTFEVAKQNESDEEYKDDKWLDGVRLEGIEVLNTHSKGTFDICKGIWSYTADKEEETLCTAACYPSLINHQMVTTSAEAVNDKLLIFPNNDEQLSLKVTFFFPAKPHEFNKKIEVTPVTNDPTLGTGFLVSVTTPLTYTDESEYNKNEVGEGVSPISFQSNYSYKFSIVVMRNDVRVLAVAPTVYNWIDDDVTLNTVVGQPVTFGNLMWMDRNLGASTYDAKNDFYGAIGYYYQYGRNIPFIMDTIQFTHFIDDDDVSDLNATSSYGFAVIMPTQESGKVQINKDVQYNGIYAPWVQHGKALKKISEEEKETLRREQVNCFYTYYESGKNRQNKEQLGQFADTVCGYTLFYRDGDSRCTTEKPFRYVGEVIRDASGNIDITLTKRCTRLSVLDKDYQEASILTWTQWTQDGSYAENYWNNVEDQPCPKGWRLPTHKELYAFMPWGSASWQDNFPKDKTTEADDKEQTDFSGWTQYLKYGKVTLENGSSYNIVFMLYTNKTTEAYRICIRSRFAIGYNDRTKESQNKRYITISRYSADPAKTLDDYLEYEDEEGKIPKDWENPIEEVQYPCSGFIVTEQSFIDLRTFGNGTVLRTSESASSTRPTEYQVAKSYAMYLSCTNYSVSVAGSTRRSLGDQIRCCRDITAQ